MVTPSSKQMKIECQLKPRDHNGQVAGSVVFTTGANETATSSTRVGSQGSDTKNTKTDSIRRGLEKTISDGARQRINAILTSVTQLSDVEKFLLYLRLPTGAAPCPLPHDSLAGRSDLAHLSTWLKTHLEEDQSICLPKQEAFDEYNEYCEKHGYKAVGQADFGRMVRAAFPNVKPRRLGPRGQSKHCYGGMKKKTDFAPPKLPDIQIPPVEDEIAEEALNDSDSVLVASSSLVCEWAHKLLNNEFHDVRNLAEYLVSNSYVDGRSEAAFTVIAASQKAGRALNLVVPVEPSTPSVSLPTTTVKPTTAPPVRQQPAPSKGPAKLQLQKKLQERELIKEQKRKLEQQRCEITGEKPVPKTSQPTRMEVGSDEHKKQHDFDLTQGGKKVDVNRERDKQKQKLNLTPQKLILPKTLATTRVPGTANNTFPRSAQVAASKPAVASSAQSVFMLSPSPARGPAGQIVPQQMVILSPVNRMVVPPPQPQTRLLHMQHPLQPGPPPLHGGPPLPNYSPPQQAIRPQGVQPLQVQPVSADVGASTPGAFVSSMGIPSTRVMTHQPQVVTHQPHVVTQPQQMLPYGTVMVQSVPTLSGNNDLPMPERTHHLPVTKQAAPLGGHVVNISSQQIALPKFAASGEVVKVACSQSGKAASSHIGEKLLSYCDVNRGVMKNTSLLQQALQKQEQMDDSKIVSFFGGDPGPFTVSLDAQQGAVSSPSSSLSSDSNYTTRTRTVSLSTQRSVGSVTSEDSCDSQNLVSPPPLTGVTPGEIFMSPASSGAPTASSSSGSQAKSSRSKCAVSKSRLSGKTVSTLLREQRGVTHAVPEKKGFENDRRPVAQLLKECREKKQHGPSALSPVIQLMSPGPVPSPAAPNAAPSLPASAVGVNRGAAKTQEQQLLFHTITLNNHLNISNVVRQTPERGLDSAAPVSHHSPGMYVGQGTTVMNNNSSVLPNVSTQTVATDNRALTSAQSSGSTLTATSIAPGGNSSTSSADNDVTQSAQDLSSGVLAKLLRGEIDTSKVENHTDETDTNYSALKQALADNSKRDFNFKSVKQKCSSSKKSSYGEFVEVANIQVSSARKANAKAGDRSSNNILNNNKFPTLEALVSQKPSDRDISNVEKDALQEYLRNEPVPDLADITPSIAQMVSCEDEGTLTEQSNKSSANAQQNLLEWTQVLSGQSQDPQNVSGPFLLGAPSDPVSSGQNSGTSAPGGHEDNLINATQLMLEIHQKQQQQVQGKTDGNISFINNADTKLNPGVGQPCSMRNFMVDYMHNNPSSADGLFDSSREPATQQAVGYVTQAGVQLQGSPAPSVHSHQSASSTPLSMLSPQSRNNPSNTGASEPSNSFMPIQETSLDGVHSQESPGQTPMTSSSNSSHFQGPSHNQPASSNAPAQTLGFLPYASYKQPPDYETSVQNQKLLLQKLLQQQQQQQAQTMPAKQQQQQPQPTLRQQLLFAHGGRPTDLQCLLPSAIQLSNSNSQAAVHNTLPSLPQFAPVSSIKPVKRGRGTTTGKGSKRVRHSSAQDSMLTRSARNKDLALAGLGIAHPGPTAAVGADNMAAYRPVTVSVPKPEAASVHSNPLSNPSESPFSPEIQDIMGGGSDNFSLEQTFASAYRSHSVPALMLGGCSEEMSDIFRTSTTTDQRPDCADILDSMPNSEIASLLQGKLHQESAHGPQRGLPNHHGDYGARKNLTQMLEGRSGGGAHSPHSFITRGDHLISGAPVRPPLKYAFQQQLGGLAMANNHHHHHHLSHHHHAVGQVYHAANPVPTPPSSQNPTPDFSAELVVADGTQGFGVAPAGNNSALDTPNSLESVPSQEGHPDLTDHLFSSTGDISQGLATDQQIDMTWS